MERIVIKATRVRYEQTLVEVELPAERLAWLQDRPAELSAWARASVPFGKVIEPWHGSTIVYTGAEIIVDGAKG